jgi:hypothetical protein
MRNLTVLIIMICLTLVPGKKSSKKKEEDKPKGLPNFYLYLINYSWYGDRD